MIQIVGSSVQGGGRAAGWQGQWEGRDRDKVLPRAGKWLFAKQNQPCLYFNNWYVCVNVQENPSLILARVLALQKSICSADSEYLQQQSTCVMLL